MGISRGTSTRWLFLYCVQIELEFRDAGFGGEGKTGVPGENPLGARTRTNNKLNLRLTPSPGLERGPHWWEESTVFRCAIPAPSNSSTGGNFGMGIVVDCT